MSPTVLFGMSAGTVAILAEYLYKQPFASASPWWHYLWLWTPLQLAIGYSIYRLVNIPGLSIIDAFVVFAACTAGLRILLSYGILGQEIKTGTWIAFGLILAAQVVRTFWEKWTT